MKRFLIYAFFALLCASIVYAGTTETSGITANTIITNARRHLNASNDSTFFVASDFLVWIDEAVKDIAARTECLESTPVTVTMATATYRYSLGQSFLNVAHIEHDNNDTTDPYQIIGLDRVNKTVLKSKVRESGRPKFFAVWNNQIEVWPKPSSAEASTYLYVYPVSIPTGVSTTSSPIETPTYFDLALVYYAVAMGHYKSGSMLPSAVGDAYMAMYEKKIAEYNALVLQKEPKR